MRVLREPFLDLMDFAARRYGPLLETFLQTGRRSWRRFTTMGRLVLFGYGMTLLFVVNTRASMNYQLFTLLLVMLTAAFTGSLLMGRRRKSLEVRRVLPQYVTAGEAFAYTVEVRNSGEQEESELRIMESPRMARFSANTCQMSGESEPDQHRRVNRHVRARWRRLLERTPDPEADEPRFGPLAPGESARVRLNVRGATRGLLEFGPVQLAQPDPLGLFHAFAGVRAQDTLLVLPRRYELAALELPGGRRYQPGGVTQSANAGESGEFASLRDYRKGDPPKHIHWRSWAKVGRPIVKEYQDEFFTRHALVLDTFPDPERLPGSRDATLFEEAVSVAASFVVLERQEDSLLDLLFVGNRAHRFTAGRGLAQSGQMLEALAAVSPCLDKPFELLQRTVLRHAERICGCICVLLAWDEHRRELVRGLLAAGVEPLVFVLLDSRAPLPDPGPLQGRPAGFHPLRLGQVKEDLEQLRTNGLFAG